MKVVWQRQDLNRLRMPMVCAVTGQPAAGRTGVWFGKQWARWVPAVVRIGVTLTNRPVVVQIPMSEPLLRQQNKRRLLALLSVLGIVAAIVSPAVLHTMIGGVVFLLLVAASIGWIIYLSTKLNVVGADVNGDRLSMDRVAPQFAEALVAANAPGTVQVVPDGVRR